ncbi:MAG: hypothetical protein P1U54_01840 [Immundisolibacteraceae bacterium]|nr:hypothetical protein [Immundisolibacteraceae bacterium]
MADQLILMIYSQSASMQRWQGRRLLDQWPLTTAEQSREAIASIIKDHAKSPMTVVLDTADEEIRQALIPKILGNGRRQLQQRTLQQAFPNNAYRAFTSQGSVRGKRTDERLLLIAITHDELLDSWLKLLADNQALVCRVTTASVLLTELARKVGGQNEHELLVYRHPEQGLRQLFLDNGRPGLSRLSMPTAGSGNIVDQFATEAANTRQYLNNSKAIPRDAPLTVRILNRDHMRDALNTGLADLAQVDLQLSNLSSLVERFTLKLPDIEPSAEHLLGSIAANYPQKLVDLSPAHVRREYNRFTAGRWTVYAASVATAAMLMWSATEFFAVWEISNRADEQKELLSRWQQLEQNAIADALPSSVPPATMKQASELIEQLREERRFPEPALRRVAAALADHQHLRYRKIEWAAPDQALTRYQQPKQIDDNIDQFSDSMEPEGTPAPTEHLFLEFQIEPFDGDYLTATIEAENTVKMLAQLPGAKSAKMVSAPLNVDSQSDFSENIALGEQSERQKPQARFQVVITLENPANVTTVVP